MCEYVYGNATHSFTIQRYTVLVNLAYEPYRWAPGRGAPAEDLGPGVYREGPLDADGTAICAIFEAKYLMVEVADARAPSERIPTCDLAAQLRELLRSGLQIS